MKFSSVILAWLDDEPTVILRHRTSTAVVALRGATVLSWVADLGGELIDLVDGYRTADELRSQSGVRNGIMAPFCDRVADARYIFDGSAFDLLPGQSSRLIYHGLVRSMPFALGVVDEDDDGLEATFECRGLSNEPHPGYPFAVDVSVTYRLGAASLGVEITGHNRGTVSAPFASGWHPYFRLSEAATVDGLDLHVPSTVRVETDAALIPHQGQCAHVTIGPDEARWEPIGDAVLDVGYVAGGIGGEPTVLRDRASGLQLTLTQDSGLVHLFTGDTLERYRRASIAVEPVEAMTDAFNRPDCATAIRLEPGSSRAFRATVTVTHPRLSHEGH